MSLIIILQLSLNGFKVSTRTGRS